VAGVRHTLLAMAELMLFHHAHDADAARQAEARVLELLG
jgi:hypothetical protein